MATTAPRSAPRTEPNQADPDTALELVSADDAPSTAAIFRPVTKRQQTLVLVCAFLVIFQTIGFNQTYGVFQEYYTSPTQTFLPARETANPALVAFIGTLGSGLTWAGGIYVNPMLARTSRPAHLMLAGVALMSGAFALASLAQTIWQLLLTQGLLYGLGSALVYFPPIAVAPEYFGARRGAAMGFILSGSGVGGLVLAPATRALLSALGARWTLRVLCLLNLALGVPVSLLCPPTRSVRARPTLVSGHVARTPVFVFAILGAFLQSGGYFVPLTYFASFSAALGYSGSFAAVLLGLSNAVNAVSRVGMGFAADQVGRQNTLIVCCIGSALSVLVLWSIAAAGAVRAAWLVFIVAYGILSGGYNALLPTTIAEVFGVHTYPSINGLLYFVRGCGVFFGSPVGGTILERSSSGTTSSSAADFTNVVWYDGALLIAGAICVVLVRGYHAKDRGVWKWKA